MKRLLIALSLLTCLCSALFAQEFEIKKYDVNAKINVAARSFALDLRFVRDVFPISGNQRLSALKSHFVA